MKGFDQGQYRALIGYINEWSPQFDLQDAIRDIGISASEEDVLDVLAGCCWEFGDDGKLYYTGD